MTTGNFQKDLNRPNILKIFIFYRWDAKDIAFFVSAATGVVVVGTVQLMKLANRSAQRRIAAGEFPDFGALGTERGSDGMEALPKGTGSER